MPLFTFKQAVLIAFGFGRSEHQNRLIREPSNGTLTPFAHEITEGKGPCMCTDPRVGVGQRCVFTLTVGCKEITEAVMIGSRLALTFGAYFETVRCVWVGCVFQS
jgi:hypothetical protein